MAPRASVIVANAARYEIVHQGAMWERVMCCVDELITKSNFRLSLYT